jgi:hypothetical protein
MGSLGGDVHGSAMAECTDLPWTCLRDMNTCTAIVIGMNTARM